MRFYIQKIWLRSDQLCATKSHWLSKCILSPRFNTTSTHWNGDAFFRLFSPEKNTQGRQTKRPWERIHSIYSLGTPKEIGGDKKLHCVTVLWYSTHMILKAKFWTMSNMNSIWAMLRHIRFSNAVALITSNWLCWLATSFSWQGCDRSFQGCLPSKRNWLEQ